MKKYIALVFAILFLIPASSYAQLPTCATNPSTVIYIQTGSTIYNYDVTLPISATNPSTNTIVLPSGAGGLAVSNNLNGPGPSPTFYTSVGGNYWYYDGAAWVNTGHSCGGGGAVNSGGGGNYLYNLVGGSGEVWQYDGSGPATLLITVPGFSGGGPYDLVGDCDGGFYILKTNQGTPAPFLRKYDAMANLVTTWTATGSASSAGGGFAIVNNTVYYHNTSGFNSAPFVTGPGNLAFSLVGATIPSPSDMACCPVCATPPIPPPAADFIISEDTICVGSCVDFTDLSTGSATSWNWTFPGGTPANSAVQNPSGVCFNTAGIFNIKQVATNAGGSDSITKQLVVVPLPQVVTTSTLTNCDIDNGEAEAVGSLGRLPYSYSWSSGSNLNIATGLGVGVYTVTLTDSRMCQATATATINQHPNPTATITPYPVTQIDVGDQVQLQASGGVSYNWLNTLGLGCSNCSNPVAKPPNDMVYCVNVTDINGCSDTACTTILVDTSCGIIIVPNAFTPNGDGLNDYIEFSNNCIEALKFAIFNRWGQKIYEANSLEAKWDGTYNGEKQLISTYFYVLEAKLKNGRTIRQRGDITLIR